MKYLILISFLSLFVTKGNSQTTFRYGGELGISASVLPRWVNSKIMETDTKYSKLLPIVGPIAGLTLQMTTKDIFQLNIGIQYQLTGYKDYSIRDGRIPRVPELPEQFTYTHERWEEQTFHKLNIPMTIGYVFRERKFKHSIFLGYATNIFLSGKYYYAYKTDATDDSQDRSNEHEYNPVSTTGVPIPKIAGQITTGYTLALSKRLSLKATLQYGKSFEHLNYKPYGWETYYNYFKNKSIAISAVYFLYKTKQLVLKAPHQSHK
ncbi:MAG: outer membrane beta-barrel protein [Putridiphycobacter sp.]|nr:outer membrane beta-barrel protein [Putridiphycobacter sp.]